MVKHSRKFRNSKNNLIGYKKLYFQIHFSFIIIVLAFFLIFPTYQTSTAPLQRLLLPKITLIELPDPLLLISFPSSVLGTQKIEPTEVVKYINLERAKIGSPPLRISQKLMQAAARRAEVILKYQNFSHQDPYEQIELTTVLPKIGYYYQYASENIGMGGVSAEDFVGGFMHSTSHRENLLNKYLSDTGVAIVTGPYKQYYVNIAVQLFAIPGSQEDYLGYTKDEVEKYKKQLAIVEIKLNPFFWTINSLLDQKNYTKKKFDELSHQKQILSNIYARMKTNLPLQNEQVSLIMEFNANL